MLKRRSVTCALIGGISLALLASLLGGADVQSRQGERAAETEAQTGGRATGKEKELDDAATPTIDFDDQGDVEPGRAKSRKLKNARHDKEAIVLSQPHSKAGEVIRDSHRHAGLSDMPADKSDLVVIGRVADARAFLSNDKTGVYSEFTITVSEVFKAAPDASVNPGDAITAERFGGKVRYPSGKVIRYRIEGQGSPTRGKEYLFFLGHAAQGDYDLLTAYEIHGPKVFALDGARINLRGEGNWAFDKHNGREVGAFLEEVRRAIGGARGEADQR